MLAFFALLTVCAAPITARFVSPGGEPYQVTLSQNGRAQRCAATPCELHVEPGAAEVGLEGAASFNFEHTYERSVVHQLAFRRTWPRWVGVALLAASVASFALWGMYAAKCGSDSPSDRVTCSSAPTGAVLGGVFLAAGLPMFIWGLFTGNRTVTEQL